jgi:WD40 repeat protein/energy-coupling factor transporter ATP-binding protein EcfA2
MGDAATGLARSVVQVLDHQDESAGTAFLVARDVLVTCAHVIEVDGAAPQEPVRIRIPQAGGAVREARPIPGQWRARRDGDIAFLRVQGNLPGVEPLGLGEASGEPDRTVVTLGFPERGASAGVRDSATIRGTVHHRSQVRLQLGDAWAITQGFSGAPIVDALTGLVVGMIADLQPMDRHGRGASTCYAIPVESLREVRPQLRPTLLAPYLGLSSFDTQHAHLFHGRDDVVDALVEKLRHDSRFLAVLGPSGSGKSSLVKAGLLPQFAGGRLTLRANWTIMQVRPSDNLRASLVNLGLTGAHRDLPSAVDSWMRANSVDDQRLVILIDQFEELLAPSSGGDAQQLLTELARLADEIPRVTTIVVMRDDFYATLAALSPQLIRRVEGNLVNVTARLNRNQLSQIIQEPARTTGTVLAPGLTDILIDQATGGDDDAPVTVLPLLEFTLTELWNARVGGRLTATDLEVLGGVTGSLARWCDRVFTSFHHDERTVARRVLTALIIAGDPVAASPVVGLRGLPVMRRRRSMSYLEQTCAIDEGGAQQVRKVVNAMVTARLLVSHHSHLDAVPNVELIHDALAREWPMLTDWVTAERDYAQWEQGITERASSWQSAHSADDLLPPTRLAEAEARLAERPVSEQIKDFVNASRAAQRARRRHRLVGRARLIAVVAAALVIALVALSVARSFQARSNHAEQRSAADRLKADSAAAAALAEQATNVLDTAPDTAARLASAALWLAKTPTAYGAASLVLASPRLPSTLIHDPQFAERTVSFTPDGHSYITTRVPRDWQGRDAPPATAQRWSTDDHHAMASQLHPSMNSRTAPGTALYALDERTIALLDNGQVRLWDTETQRPRTPAPTLDQVSSLRLTRDAQTIVATRRGRLLLWDKDSGRVLANEQAPGGPITAACPLPDGSVVTISHQGELDVWRASSRRWARLRPPDDAVSDAVSLAATPDGRDVFVQTQQGKIFLVAQGFAAQVLADRASHMTVSDDSDVLAFIGTDHQLQVWWRSDPHLVRIPTPGGLTDLSFVPGSRALAAVQADGDLRFWDATGVQPLGDTVTASDHVLVAAHADIVATTDPYATRVWELTSHRLLSTIPTTDQFRVALSPDGSRLATIRTVLGPTVQNQSTVSLWDTHTGKRLATSPPVPRIDQILFHPNGTAVLINTSRGMIMMPLTTLQPGAPSGSVGSPVVAVGFGPGHSSLAVTTEASVAEIRNADTWRLTTAPLIGHTSAITCASLTADGAMVATGSLDGTVRLWDTRLGRQKGSPLNTDSSSVDEVVVDPNGQWIAAVYPTTTGIPGQTGITLAFWDVETHQLLGKTVLSRLDTPYTSHSATLAVTSDGNHILTNALNIRLWAPPNRWPSELCTRAGRNLTPAEWRADLGPDRPYQRICPQFP